MKKIRLTEAQLSMVMGEQNINEGFMDKLKNAAVGGAMGLATLGGMQSCGPNEVDPKVEQASQTLDYLQMNLNQLCDEYGNENYDFLSQFFPDNVQDCMDMSREDADRLIDMAKYHVEHKGQYDESVRREFVNNITESVIRRLRS